MEVRIEKAEKRDAEFISDTILRAVGHDVQGSIDDDQTDKRELRELFRLLAEREDTQYSYRNTLVARDDKGEALGALVSYDGADLKRLRKVFIETANRLMNWGIDEERIHDETGPGEIYIDSLMVLPEYRGKGIARKLIEATMERHKKAGKPFGLIVSPENSSALKLYEKMGFRKVGTTRFLGEDMLHLQR